MLCTLQCFERPSQTHRRVANKGAAKEAKLRFTVSVLMENRNGIHDRSASEPSSRSSRAGAGDSRCLKRCAGGSVRKFVFEPGRPLG